MHINKNQLDDERGFVRWIKLSIITSGPISNALRFESSQPLCLV